MDEKKLKSLLYGLLGAGVKNGLDFVYAILGRAGSFRVVPYYVLRDTRSMFVVAIRDIRQINRVEGVFNVNPDALMFIVKDLNLNEDELLYMTGTFDIGETLSNHIVDALRKEKNIVYTDNKEYEKAVYELFDENISNKHLFN